MRQLYHAVRRLNEAGKDPEPYVGREHDSKLVSNEWERKELSLRLEFIEADGPESAAAAMRTHWKAGSGRDYPSIFVAGFATHSIKASNDSTEALEEFRGALKELLLPEVEWMARVGKSKFIWMQQPTVYEENLVAERTMITPAAINRYNRVAASVLAESSAVVWSSMPSLVWELVDEMEDGLHIPVTALKQATQVSRDVLFRHAAKNSQSRLRCL